MKRMLNWWIHDIGAKVTSNPNILETVACYRLSAREILGHVLCAIRLFNNLRREIRELSGILFGSDFFNSENPYASVLKDFSAIELYDPFFHVLKLDVRKIPRHMNFRQRESCLVFVWEVGIPLSDVF